MRLCFLRFSDLGLFEGFQTRVGFAFGSNGSGQFDFLKEIRSGRVRSIYMLCFFKSLINFDWIKCHLFSGRVGSGQVLLGLSQVSLIFFKISDQIEFGFGRVRQNPCRVGFCHFYVSITGLRHTTDWWLCVSVLG
jgi:hypothetical protein